MRYVANKRMISRGIIESDRFAEVDKSAQLLYFYLLISADDEGFVANPRRILKLLDIEFEEMKKLARSRLLVLFDTGICAITDWNIHNWIRDNRKKKTIFTSERNALEAKENDSYRLKPDIKLESGIVIITHDSKDSEISGRSISEINVGDLQHPTINQISEIGRAHV